MLWQYGLLTGKEAGHPRLAYASPGIAADPTGFLASGHTFRVAPDLDPAASGKERVRPHDLNPTTWVVDSSAGSTKRLPKGLVRWKAANFTVPAVLRVGFTLEETWATSAAHTRGVWAHWEAWTATALASAPPGLHGGFQTSDVRACDCWLLRRSLCCTARLHAAGFRRVAAMA